MNDSRLVLKCQCPRQCLHPCPLVCLLASSPTTLHSILLPTSTRGILPHAQSARLITSPEQDQTLLQLVHTLLLHIPPFSAQTYLVLRSSQTLIQAQPQAGSSVGQSYPRNHMHNIPQLPHINGIHLCPLTNKHIIIPSSAECMLPIMPMISNQSLFPRLCQQKIRRSQSPRNQAHL